jgi:hypothetical protein
MTAKGTRCQRQVVNPLEWSEELRKTLDLTRCIVHQPKKEKSC